MAAPHAVCYDRPMTARPDEDLQGLKQLRNIYTDDELRALGVDPLATTADETAVPPSTASTIARGLGVPPPTPSDPSTSTALTLAGSTRDVVVQHRELRDRAIALSYTGALDEAIATYSVAADAAEVSGDLATASIYRFNMRRMVVALHVRRRYFSVHEWYPPRLKLQVERLFTVEGLDGVYVIDQLEHCARVDDDLRPDHELGLLLSLADVPILKTRRRRGRRRNDNIVESGGSAGNRTRVLELPSRAST